MSAPPLAQEAPPYLRHEIMLLDRMKYLCRHQRLWAVADAGASPLVRPKVAELGPARAVSLYRGAAEEALAAAAPYLLAVDEETLQWIYDWLWAEAWGIFLCARLELEVIRRHLRTLLVVRSPQGERWMMRFYDPWALRALLDVCTPAEQRAWLGPLDAFGMPEPQVGVLWRVGADRLSPRASVPIPVVIPPRPPANVPVHP